MYSEEQQTKKLFGTDSTMGLFVSLYLILLAFFILLNAMSDQAVSKAEKALESVNATFHKANNPQNKKTTDPDAIDQPENNHALRAISRAFYSEMEIEGRFSSSGGNVLEVEFPASYLFERGSLQMRGEMYPFLNQLLAAIDVKNIHGNQIAFLFGSGTGPVSRDLTRSQEIAVRRAGSLARYMQKSGVPDGMFTTGFVAIPENNILAVFQSSESMHVGGLNVQ